MQTKKLNKEEENQRIYKHLYDRLKFDYSKGPLSENQIKELLDLTFQWLDDHNPPMQWNLIFRKHPHYETVLVFLRQSFLTFEGSFGDICKKYDIKDDEVTEDEMIQFDELAQIPIDFFQQRKLTKLEHKVIETGDEQNPDSPRGGYNFPKKFKLVPSQEVEGQVVLKREIEMNKKIYWKKEGWIAKKQQDNLYEWRMDKNVYMVQVYALIKYLMKADSNQIPTIIIKAGFHEDEQENRTDDVQITHSVRKMIKDLKLTKKQLKNILLLTPQNQCQYDFAEFTLLANHVIFPLYNGGKSKQFSEPSYSKLIQDLLNGNVEGVKQWIQKCGNPEDYYEELCESLLSKACQLPDEEHYKLYSSVNKGQQEVQKYSISKTEQRKLEIVKLLIQKGSWVDDQDPEGMTPLMWAAQANYLSIVQYLVEKEADVLLLDEKGWDVLMMAVIFQRAQIVNFLLQNGAKQSKSVDDGKNPKDQAWLIGIDYGRWEIYNLFQKHDC